MHVNGKMIPVELTPGKGERKMRMIEGGEFKYDIFEIL
jgi:hypothetical protein